MRSTFKVLFYVKKGSERPNGNLPLMCRITVDSEVKQFSCKMDVPLHLWDVKNNRASGKSAEAQKINLTIDRIRVDVNRRYRELMHADGYVTATKLKNAYLGIGVKYKVQDDINLLFSVFPHLNERLRIAQLCKVVGLMIDSIKQLFTGEAVSIDGKLHSPEHDQSFNVQDAKLQLFKESKDSDRLKLSINGTNIIDWFKQKYQEVQQTVRPHIKLVPPKQKRGQGV